MKRREQNTKLSHGDFIRMMVVSALSILLSLTALVSMSWAWFTESEKSGEETLTAAQFDLQIELDGAVQELSLSDALGYEKQGDAWVKNGTEATGIFRV